MHGCSRGTVHPRGAWEYRLLLRSASAGCCWRLSAAALSVMELEPPDSGFRLPLMGHGRLFVANRLGSLGGQLPLAAIGCLGGRLWLQPRAAASGCCLWLLPLAAASAAVSWPCTQHGLVSSASPNGEALRLGRASDGKVALALHTSRACTELLLPLSQGCCLPLGRAPSTGLCLPHRRAAMLAPRSA